MTEFALNVVIIYFGVAFSFLLEFSRVKTRKNVPSYFLLKYFLFDFLQKYLLVIQQYAAFVQLQQALRQTLQ